MTPVEKLEAAIAKLEMLRSSVPEGPWRVEDGRGDNGGYTTSIYSPTSREYVTDMDGYLSDEFALITVTLHRTIDAQLELMRLSLDFVKRSPSASSFEGGGTGIADAILGADS